MNADLLEIAWTLVNGTAAIVTLLLFLDSLKDYKVSYESGHRGLRWLSAERDRRDCFFVFLIELMLFLPGPISMFRAPPPESGGSGRLFSILFLMGAALLLLLNALLNFRSKLEHRSYREESVNTTSESLARIEAGNAVVAENLAIAQTAVDGVASDLATAHRRADAIEGDPGEAADAASRSPDE